MEDDTASVFTHFEDRPISLSGLASVANRLFSPKTCFLKKIEEGGFHKVYDVVTIDGEELGVVARVASCVFPKDKLESEVATMKYIAEKTSIPIPKVIHWNSDANNEVGADYMFLSKVNGKPASRVWGLLSDDSKINMVRQVAKFMLEIWELRFDAMGSLYFSDDNLGYKVGPIVEARFSEKIDGYSRTEVPIDLSEFRGPFKSVSSYLASGLQVDLKLYRERRQDLIDEEDGNEEYVESGKRAMELALSLCEIYPGDRPISGDDKEPISLYLNDVDDRNVMVDPATGNVEALIDFEWATTAPCWFCAEVPNLIRWEEIDAAEYQDEEGNERSRNSWGWTPNGSGC